MSTQATTIEVHGAAEPTVTRVTSRDGTEIAYSTTGEGPPLVLVHGTSVDRWSFRLVEPLLADRLLGSESPEWAKRGTELVHSLLPNSQVGGLEGQGHVAFMTAPELFADQVIRFLAAPRGRDEGGEP